MISVALKTHLEIRLGICIYETSVQHRPDDYLISHQAVPPHFTTKLLPWFHGSGFGMKQVQKRLHKT